MDSDCLTLLPSVCEVLADSTLLLHDDTSLEKLLDCFKELITQKDEQYLMQYLPYLLQFLQSITKSQTVDPSVFSFSLKLVGLLAAKEYSFTLLEEKGVLEYMFQPESWHMLELWKNSSVRYGWLQGLWNMLQHPQSMNFFCKNGFIKLLLHLQNDKGLFITSLTSQILAHILNSFMPVVLSNSTKSETPNCCPVSTEFVSVTKEIMSHVAASLASQEQAVIISALRLLATILTECGEPLKRMIWEHVVGPLEVLANAKDDSFTLHIIAVLQAVARSPVLIQPDCRVETLMDIMLFSRSATESVQCAAIILQMEDCPEVLKWKATDVIMLPLLCASASPLQLHEPDKLNGYISHLEKQLSLKAFCVCLLTQSLSGIAEHKSLTDIPVQLIASSVIKLLKICIGHRPFTLLEAGTFPHLIGCYKVQQCSIDLLGDLTVYAESMDLIQEAFTVLLQYLQYPGTHATVLKKTHQATLKWLSICSPSSDLWRTVIHELFQLMKKHVCDGRWEVRDSTLEFITQLTANLKGNSKYTETLHSSGMISVLFTSLSDLEGYVQASAVAALGEAITTSDVCSNVQEKAVTHLLSILSQDTQSFPHRAAVKVFTAWLKSPHCCTALEQSLSSVLLLAGNDFDWEVKVHTLELADVLMDKSLDHCPCHFQKIYRSSESTCLMQALTKLKDLGVFEFLFKCLFDCDRTVCQKACSLLLKLRTFMKEIATVDHKVLRLEICKYSWNEEILHRYHKNREAIELNCVKNGDKVSCRQMDSEDSLDVSPKEMDLCQILELLDLEKMQHTLSLSSDHVINSPKSLMEDILFMTRESEKNIADCY
ncbi:BRCA1-associated ATM activator 1 isoform X2 [Pangasianodon hypophthalmus]|uniref:BRCA1-associated ATM activator 1 isoform X2 n=1 Tax=Pangasianodon hypophthalmus TaxID=310915 RepID=UPI0023077E5D|nr:BRCA1-associated ATM activator 1 isoform X2 [Pangasianodon hypophthalmus]